MDLWNLEKKVERRKHHIAMICANGLLSDARVLKTAESARKAGYRVTLFGFHDDPKNSCYENIRGFNFEIIRFPNPAWALKKQGQWGKCMSEKNFPAFCSDFADYISRYSMDKDFDAIYSHDMYGIAVAGKLLSNGPLADLPWMHDVHEYVEGLTELADDLYDYVLGQERKFIQKASRLSTVSPILQEKIKQTYGVSACEFIPNCPRLGDFNPDYADIATDCGFDRNSEVKLLTYHGNVKPIRSVDKLINALEFLPAEFHVAIISNANSDYARDLKILAHSVAKNRVHFLPYVPSHLVSSYIRTSFAAIHTIESYPNSELALPNKLFEALHADVPFICPPLAAMTTFVDEHACGVVAKSNKPRHLANAVLLMADDRTRKEKVSQETKYRYSWEKCESIIIDTMLDSVLIPAHNGSLKRSRSERSQPFDVVHLPAFSAGQPSALAKSLDSRFFDAKSGSLAGLNRFGYKADSLLRCNEYLEPQRNAVIQFDNLIKYLNANGLMQDTDIFHFHARSLLYTKQLELSYVLSDLAYLKVSGKRVFFHFRGSEARLKSVFNRKSPYSWFVELDNCDDKLEKKEMLAQCPYDFDENAQINFIRKATAFSSEIFVTDPEIGSYVPNATIVPRTVDRGLFELGKNRRYKENIDRTNPLRIVHAPSRPFIKGREYLHKAVNELSEEGYHIELDLVTDVSNSEAIERYRRADIAVDQLRIGWYGVFSVEAMALGLPVICFIRDDLLHYLPKDRPVLNADCSNIKGVIKRLYDNSGCIEEYGAGAYRYALSVHHPDRVGKLLESIYMDLWEKPKSAQDLAEFSRAFNWGVSDSNFTDTESAHRVTEDARGLTAFLCSGIRAEIEKDYQRASKCYKRLIEIGELDSVEVKYALSRSRIIADRVSS